MEQPRIYSYSRFSSLTQGRGYSLERQIKRAEEWCRERGLALEQAHSDQGKSAYHGSHLASGALGLFIADIEAGKIPPGSILLVEQLDRLTRQNLHEAQGLIWRILDAGIKIITLADEKEYTKEQGLGGVIMMLVALEASHLESFKKADRLRASWEKRAEKAEAGQIISKRLPGWLEIKDEKIVEIPERAATLKEMFDLAGQGMGITAIAGRLNQRKTPTWGGSRSWRRSVIYQILTNPAAFGTLALKMAAGTKEIEGYFPATIDKGLFLKVQKSLSDKTFDGGSRRAGRNAGYTNLFSGIGFCAECGSRMAIINAGPKNGGHRLVCDDARLGRGCKYVSLLYGPVESAILQFCQEIDLTRLTGGNNESELAAARAEVQRLQNMLEGQQAQVEAELQLSAAVKTPEMIKLLAGRLDSLQNEMTATKAKAEEAERAVEKLSRSGNVVIEHLQAVRKLKEQLQESDQDKLIETRRKLRVALASAIERIDFYPEGFDQIGTAIFKDKGIVVAEYGSEDFKQEFPEDVQNLYEIVPKTAGRKNAAFLVRFRTGHCRLFQWNNVKGEFFQTKAFTAAGRFYTVPGKGLIHESEDEVFGGIKKAQKGA